MSDYGLISDPDLAEHTGFLIAEELALKNYLSGIEIPVKGQMTPVPVYFRWPTSERLIKYPFITIDLLSISPAYERWHSYFNEMETPALYESSTGAVDERFYWPGYSDDVSTDDPDNKNLWASTFLPYDIKFQISTFCRSASDDRFLISRMITDFLGPRSFFISTFADKVWHRCELLEWVSADSLETIEATKRQFRKVYTINMESEIPSSRLLELEKVRAIHVDIYDFDSDRLAPEHPIDSEDHSQILDSFTTEPPP